MVAPSLSHWASIEKNATVDNTDLFKCIAHVGVQQSSCLRYEQPLKSAFLALDPSGTNREQSLAFLRPGRLPRHHHHLRRGGLLDRRGA